MFQGEDQMIAVLVSGPVSLVKDAKTRALGGISHHMPFGYAGGESDMADYIVFPYQMRIPGKGNRRWNGLPLEQTPCAHSSPLSKIVHVYRKTPYYKPSNRIMQSHEAKLFSSTIDLRFLHLFNKQVLTRQVLSDIIGLYI